MSNELDKLRAPNEPQKSKAKLEKIGIKQMRKKFCIKGLKISRSTPNLDKIQTEATTTTSVIPGSEDINIREKYVKQMYSVYEETYKAIKALKVSSIEPVKKFFF
jgi:hypothetical protein